MLQQHNTNHSNRSIHNPDPIKFRFIISSLEQKKTEDNFPIVLLLRHQQ